MPIQAHKFLTGFAPIRSVVRVGTAAGALLAIPAEQLRRQDAAGGGGASSGAPRAALPPLSRQIQRSLTGAPAVDAPHPNPTNKAGAPALGAWGSRHTLLSGVASSNTRSVPTCCSCGPSSTLRSTMPGHRLCQPATRSSTGRITCCRTSGAMGSEGVGLRAALSSLWVEQVTMHAALVASCVG